MRGGGGGGEQVPGEAEGFYLAAEAEAQGQQAGEEVLAPSDHAGEAPAQPSHGDPRVGASAGARVWERAPATPLPALDWGGERSKARAQAPGSLSPAGAARVSGPL